MKILKSTRGAQAPPTIAFVGRLNSIISRGKAEVSNSSESVTSEKLATPQRPLRRFWTPGELATENAGA